MFHAVWLKKDTSNSIQYQTWLHKCLKIILEIYPITPYNTCKFFGQMQIMCWGKKVFSVKKYIYCIYIYISLLGGTIIPLLIKYGSSVLWGS